MRQKKKRTTDTLFISRVFIVFAVVIVVFFLFRSFCIDDKHFYFILFLSSLFLFCYLILCHILSISFSLIVTRDGQRKRERESRGEREREREWSRKRVVSIIFGSYCFSTIYFSGVMHSPEPLSIDVKMSVLIKAYTQKSLSITK